MGNVLQVLPLCPISPLMNTEKPAVLSLFLYGIGYELLSKSVMGKRVVQYSDKFMHGNVLY